MRRNCAGLFLLDWLGQEDQLTWWNRHQVLGGPMSAAAGLAAVGRLMYVLRSSQ